MPRDSLSEFQLLDFAKRSPKPAAEKPHFSGPTPLDPWMDSNSRATTTDAHTEAERRERVAASRRLGVAMVLSCLVFVSIGKWLGFL